MPAYYSWPNSGMNDRYNSFSPYLRGFMGYVMANYGGRDLGGHVERPIRGGSLPSAHAHGAAWDWGYSSRADAERLMYWVVTNADALGIQAIHDYRRGMKWRAGEGWTQYRGSGVGDSHLHFEVDREHWATPFSPRGGTQRGGEIGPEQAAQILYQVGFRGQALINFVALSGKESGWDANARGDNGQSYGLFQVYTANWNRLRQAGIISRPEDLFDPVTNARAAFFLSGGGANLQPWGAGSGGRWGGWSLVRQPDIQEATNAVESARASGLLGQHWSPGGGYYGGIPGGGPGVGPVELPRDAQLVRTDRGLFAVFNLGKGVFISYSVPGDGSVIFDRSEVTRMSHDRFRQRFARPVDGGSALELGAVTEEWGTFRSFFENVLIENIGMNNPARNDPGVRRILAQAAARPDMSDSEFRHRLEGTRWWKQRTESELLWNDLSPAEQRKRRQDAAVQMAQVWFQLTGEQASMREMLDSVWVDDVASGRVTIGWWAEKFVKPVAGASPESPWSRTVREEEENQRQRPIDIENTANQVRQTVNQWGLKWSNATIMKWATDIMEKTKSDDDLIKTVQEQSTALYPLKQPEVDTTTYAQPWIQVFSQVMENEGTVFTPQVQKALQSGMTAWDFEQQLKASPERLATAGGQEEMDEKIAGLGRMFGFIS